WVGKPSPPDMLGWSSPWGRGRPGWHIECSAMVERHLGETIDIHGGGVDLVFPHHENEVAQSTCVHAGKTYARFWVHNGLVVVNGEKMSKSLGNFLLVRDVLAEHGAESVRLALLKVHSRQPLDWTGSLVGEARQNLDRLYGALRDAGVTGAAVAPDAAVDVTPGVLVAPRGSVCCAAWLARRARGRSQSPARAQRAPRRRALDKHEP